MSVRRTTCRATGLAALLVVLGLLPARQVEAVETTLTFSADRLTLEEVDGTTRVSYQGAVNGADVAGAPSLPTVTVFIEAPAAMTVERVEFEVLETQALGVHRLAATLPDHPSDSAPPVAMALDPRIEVSQAPYPGELAAFAGRGAMRGRNLLSFTLRPVRWWPASGELELIRRLRLRYELTGAPPLALPRHRVVPQTEARFAPALARLLTPGDGAAESFAGMMPDPNGVAGPGPFQPTFRPTPDGSPVECVIVTSEELAPEFERLARWKTEKGVQAVVRTIEWIDQTYPNGVDQAERVRFFVQDAYQNWGTLFVLLGGDTDVVPPRYARSELLTGENIPADYYYSCLEGNWNADGDTRFGESFLSELNPGDDVDLMPEVYVGRAPVSTVAQAAVFVDKTLEYDQDPASGNGYPPSILYLAERLFLTVDGAVIAEAADLIVSPWFKRVKLYEEYQNWPGSLPETLESVVDSVNNGFGIVYHVGHGYRNTMAIGVDVLNNADADAFVNGPRNSVVFAINCSSASIDFNSIGERWVKNPNGGSVAYIGTSRNAFVNASSDYQEHWLTAVFVDSLRSLGEACTVGRLPLVPIATFDNSHRWTIYALTLLGDPELDLHTMSTAPLTAIHTPSHTLGSGPFLVTVESVGTPVPDATVTLWKDGEAYALGQTGITGEVLLDFLPETPGPATLTVHRSNYQIYQTPVDVVGAGGPYLYLLAAEIDDDSIPPSNGDADGRIDVGETIELEVTLKNGGGAGVTGAAATLTVEDPGGHLTILDDQVSFGTIAAGGARIGTEPFLLTVDPAAPEAFLPLFTLTITSDQGGFSDRFVLPVHRSFLEHYAHEIDDSAPRGNGNGVVEAGEEIHYSISLRNTGQETALAVGAHLEALRASDLGREPLVTVTDSTASFGFIPVDVTATGDRFVFQLDGSLDPGSILLRVTLNDGFGLVREELLDVVPPGVADSLLTFGSPSSILLKWSRPIDPDVSGYDIYRALNQGGPFERVNDHLGAGSAIFEDSGLPALTRFYYRVVARDSSYNEGSESAVFFGSTNPGASVGWPAELGQQAQSSLQLANTAGGSDNELFTAAEYQYGWHADGTEIVDGDNDPRTNGVYAIDGFHPSKAFSATCALGDMDRDGTVEIANVGWSVTQAYLWDNAGALKPGWPQPVFGDFNWPSPLMADLDGDLDLELVIWAANGGRLLAWHHDGSEVVDGDQNPGTHGILTPRVSGANFSFSSPAAADLDGDQLPEIVFCVNLIGDNSGGIYAVNGDDGTPVPGWPVFTGDASHPSQITASPAIGDLDRNGANEVVVASERGGGRIHVLNSDGSDYPGWPIDVPAYTAQVRTGSPVLADLDGDGFLDIIFPGSNGRLYAWDRNGTLLGGFPVTYYDLGGEATQSTPTIGDLDDDGEMEILLGDEAGRVHAFNHDGSPVAGFPIQLNGEARSSPILWDIDNDGLIEVGIVGWDASVYVWDLPFEWNPDRIPWPFFRHDVANTGYVGSDVLPVGIAEPAPGAVRRVAAVHPARPNPFNPQTTLAFEVPGPHETPVTLTIYDVEGRVVTRLLDRKAPAGRHEVVWNGRGAGGREVAAGVYFYRVTIGDFTAAKKLTLIK